MAAIDFTADEEESSGIDFTPDAPSAVAQAPRPIIPPDENLIAQSEKKADLFAAQQQARRQGEYWQGVADRIDRLTGTTVEPLSRGVAGTFGRAADAAINLITGRPQVGPGQRGLTETALEAPTINLPKAGEAETPIGKAAAGTYNAATDLIAGFSSPNALLTLPAGVNKAVLTGWISQMAGNAPGRVIKAHQLFKEGKPQEAWQEIATGVGESGMAVAGARHLMSEPGVPTRADVRPDIIDPRAAQDIALQLTDPRYAQRQIVMPESLRELAKEPITTGEPNAIREQQTAETVRGMPEQPVENEPLPAEEGGGGVSPSGVPPGDEAGAPRAEEAGTGEVPLTLTPAVRIGEQTFKGKAHPLAIGEASKSLGPDAPIEDLFKPESQGFTATDPTTGKERFVSRKEAADIFEKQTGKKPAKPDHLTSEDLRDAGMLGHLDEKPAEAPATKPEVVKLSTSKYKNPQGDPMGTTYRGTPEDFKAYQDIQEKIKVLREEDPGMDNPETNRKLQEVRNENERIKNKYGGMPPEPPADVTLKTRPVTEAEKTGEMYGESNWTHVEDVTDAQGNPIGKIRGNAKPGLFQVKGANIAKSQQGKGIYQKVIRQLAEKYGTVQSDTDMQPAAEAAWQKVGAEKQPDGSYKLSSAKPSVPRGIAASARVPGALKGGEAGSVSLAPLEPVAKAAVDFVKAAPTEMKIVGAQLAGKSAPKTSTASVESGNALVRYASSKIAAPLVAESMATDVLGSHYKDAEFGKKLGALLVEDRLRGIKDAFTKAGDTKAAGKVNSLIGQQDSPFQTEADFQAALADPEIRAAIDRHKATVQPAAEAAHKEAGGKMAGPGLNTGAFVNLKAIFEGGEEALLRGGGRGNLMNPLRRPSRFSKTAAGTAEKYETDYRTISQRMIEGNFEESTKRQMYDQLVKDGLAKMLNPGDPAPEIGGKPAVKFTIERKGVPAGENKVRTYVKNLWVRADLAGEVRQALDVDGTVQRSAIVNVATLINRIQLAGPTDAVWHTANMIASIAGSQGGKNVLVDMARKLPGVNMADAVGRVVASSIKVLAKTPDVQRQIAELADIGAMRTKGVAKPGKLAAIANFNHNVISLVDKAGRLVRDDLYKNLVDRGLVEDTPANRREWVNQIGQYNGRLMGQFQRFFKDAGFSPFVVAGRNFNRMAMRRITMDPGIKAISPKAALEMRAIEAFGTIATLFAIPALANYLLTGSPAGRPGTKMGQIDTGKDDNGKHVVIDPAQWTGARRGLRISGIQAVIEGAQRGETRGKITQNVINDIMGGVIHPWAGPVVNFASVARTGYSPTGYKESENPKDVGSNVMAALQQLNPAFSAFIKGYTKGTGGLKESGLSLAGAVGIKEVKPFTSYNKMGVLHQAWMEKNPDPKVKADYEQMQTATFPVSKYKALDSALADRDEAGAIKAIADLKAEGQKNKDILRRMRPFVGEGINSRTKPLFHESHKLETAFKNSLNAEQRAEYQKAIEERKATYQEFLKAWKKRDTAPKTAPAIDFVPDAGQ
jgi:hypothetical protein